MGNIIRKHYPVGDSDAVVLSITIGYGQVGATDLNLNGEKILQSHRDSLKNYELPLKGKDLRGKELYCFTTVTDFQQTTNRTSVSFSLSGGVSDFEQDLSETVQHQGDVAFYTAIFDF